MNWIDIVLLVLFLFGIFRGIMNGFVIGITSVIGLVIGIWGAKMYAPDLAGYLSKWFDLSETILVPLSFFVAFILIVIICNLLAKALDKLISVISLGWLNRLLGGIFGLVKYALILSVLLNIFNLLDNRMALMEPKTKQESLLYEPVARFTPMLFPDIEAAMKKFSTPKLEEESDSPK